jgi:hypothetical protein
MVNVVNVNIVKAACQAVGEEILNDRACLLHTRYAYSVTPTWRGLECPSGRDCSHC